jgi:hypothetical protein
MRAARPAPAPRPTLPVAYRGPGGARSFGFFTTCLAIFISATILSKILEIWEVVRSSDRKMYWKWAERWNCGNSFKEDR